MVLAEPFCEHSVHQRLEGSAHGTGSLSQKKNMAGSHQKTWKDKDAIALAVSTTQ